MRGVGGHVDGLPGAGDRALAAEGELDLAPSTVNISSKSWRCGEGPPPGGTCMSMRVYRPAVSSPVSKIV
jgi:hypothetical protein